MTKPNSAILLFAFFIFNPCASFSETAPAGEHSEIPCAECHPSGDDSRIACLDCHKELEHIHPNAETPSFAVPETFPLTDGALSCSTCHQLHNSEGWRFLRIIKSKDGDDLIDLCLACHGETLLSKNPHEAAEGSDRCVFCHTSIDEEKIFLGQEVRARTKPERLCNFCHNVRSKDHPRNIDPIMDLPSTLPRDEEGLITCVTCHNPHGSSAYTHYIREDYARHFARLQEFNPHINDRYACKSCHFENAPENITREKHAFRFQNDITVLCISCHSSARNHHPVGTFLSEEMIDRKKNGNIPLDSEGRTTCATCHSNNCDTNNPHMSLRHYDTKRMEILLCWFCHDKEKFTKINPHKKVIKDSDDSCKFCHDRPPIKGMEKSKDLYFVSRISMMCTRCHTDISDLDRSHVLKTPPDKMIENIALFAEENDSGLPLNKEGRITCTTCHNAHFDADKKKKVIRLRVKHICPICHNK